MSIPNDVEHLKVIFAETAAREQKRIALMEDPANRGAHVLSFFGINTVFFLHKAFVEGDFQASKNYLYRAAMAQAYFHEILNGEIFNVLKTFSYAVLADSPEVINRYLTYTRTQYHDSFNTYVNKAIQCVLRNDNKSLRVCIDGLKQQSETGWAKTYRPLVTIFEAIAVANKTTLEQGLTDLLALRDQQEGDALLKSFIHLEATALAKLALQKGIPVTLTSKYIPQQLLFNNELTNPRGYNFFDDLPELP